MTNRLGGFKVRQRPPASARAFPAPASEFLLRYRDDGEALLAQPFKGITTDGVIAPGLFTVGKTGVSTRPLDNDQPARTHIHTVIRTPNGNDYGRDLLRQHHRPFDHSRAGHTH